MELEFDNARHADCVHFRQIYKHCDDTPMGGSVPQIVATKPLFGVVPLPQVDALQTLIRDLQIT